MSISPPRCETCDGSGETGPHGWEYPEWHTCTACNGSGVARDEDAEYDAWKDDQL